METFNCVVQLSGFVNTSDLRTRAGDLARGAAGGKTTLRVRGNDDQPLNALYTFGRARFLASGGEGTGTLRYLSVERRARRAVVFQRFPDLANEVSRREWFLDETTESPVAYLSGDVGITRGR